MRRKLGVNLAREHPARADVIVPVPDSAIPAALGYSQETGIPLDFGLLKNRYIHRTFIRPAQSLRESGVRLKLNPIPEVLRNRRVAVLDDSIVTVTTARQIVAVIRECGAAEVHFLVSSPPVNSIFIVRMNRRGASPIAASMTGAAHPHPSPPLGA